MNEDKLPDVISDLYKSGIERGMRWALDEMRTGIKDCIRVAIELDLGKEYVNDIKVEFIYQEWCRRVAMTPLPKIKQLLDLDQGEKNDDI